MCSALEPEPGRLTIRQLSEPFQIGLIYLYHYGKNYDQNWRVNLKDNLDYSIQRLETTSGKDWAYSMIGENQIASVCFGGDSNEEKQCATVLRKIAEGYSFGDHLFGNEKDWVQGYDVILKELQAEGVPITLYETSYDWVCFILAGCVGGMYASHAWVGEIDLARNTDSDFAPWCDVFEHELVHAFGTDDHSAVFTDERKCVFGMVGGFLSGNTATTLYFCQRCKSDISDWSQIYRVTYTLPDKLVVQCPSPLEHTGGTYEPPPNEEPDPFEPPIPDNDIFYTPSSSLLEVIVRFIISYWWLFMVGSAVLIPLVLRRKIRPSSNKSSSFRPAHIVIILAGATAAILFLMWALFWS